MTRLLRSGPAGDVVAYLTPSGRCQVETILRAAPRAIRRQIGRVFEQIVSAGPDFCSERFCRVAYPRPLWKVKVFDHRIYAVRETGGRFRVVLLRGWVKDKSDHREVVNILAARRLAEEYATRRAS